MSDLVAINKPADTPVNQPTDAKPEPSAAAEPVEKASAAAGAAGGGVSPTAGQGKQEMSEAGKKIIADFAQKAGLGGLKSDGSHQGDVVNAGKVLSALTALGKKDPAMKAEVSNFLNALASAGKGILNWGQKLDGVPLNQAFRTSNAFKGVNAQQTTNTGPAQQPLNESADATQPSDATSSAQQGQSESQSVAPDKIREMVTPLLQQVAAIDKKGDSISLSDVSAALKSDGLSNDVKQLLTIMGQQIKQGGGKDIAVAQAVDHVVSLASASGQGGAQPTSANQ